MGYCIMFQENRRQEAGDDDAPGLEDTSACCEQTAGDDQDDVTLRSETELKITSRQKNGSIPVL